MIIKKNQLEANNKVRKKNNEWAKEPNTQTD